MMARRDSSHLPLTWLVDGIGKPFTKDAFSHWFGDMCDAAGLPKRTRKSGQVVRLCTPHGLRKRCCTDMAERGCTVHEIQAISGHLTAQGSRALHQDGRPGAQCGGPQ
jgi:integrase